MVRPVLLPELQDQAVQFQARQRIHGRERLVEQQHARLRRQGPRDGHPLLHAAGQLPGIAPAEVGQADHVEVLDAALFRFARRGAARVAESETHVLLHGKPWQQRARILLEQIDHAGRRRRDRPAVEPDLAGGRGHQPGDDLQQGRLAAAARSHDGDELARRHAQVDGPDGDERLGRRAEGLAHPLDLEQLSHGPPAAQGRAPSEASAAPARGTAG